VFAGLVGAGLNRQTRRQTDTVRFSVIGLVALIAVPLVMGVGAFFRTQNAPRVEPVALLKADGTPFVGFFLAETTDRVFVGTFEEKAPDPCATIRRGPCETDAERVKVPAQLLSLPASDVRNLTVGPTMPLNADDAVEGREGPQTAREWAGSAALILCEAARTARSKAEVRLADGTESALLPATCSQEDVDKLTAFLETEQAIVDDGGE
jgi:hypothetical protein